MPRSPKVWLTTEQQDDFEHFARSRTLAARLVQRAQIVLHAAAGKADVEIAQALDITRQTAGLWRRRFLDRGIAGMERDAPRSGRPRLMAPGKIDEIISLTTRQCHTVEYAHVGGGCRRQSFHGGPHLARARSQTPSREDLQTEQRPPLRRKVGRCGQPLSAPS